MKIYCDVVTRSGVEIEFSCDLFVWSGLVLKLVRDYVEFAYPYEPMANNEMLHHQPRDCLRVWIIALLSANAEPTKRGPENIQVNVESEGGTLAGSPLE